MNRAQRRAEARKTTRNPNPLTLSEVLAIAMAHLEALAASDPTVSGATLITADGEALYLPRPEKGRPQ